ncbi:MAG: FtsK/SpoIIIE domain-containing protein, partial [Acidimicrobiia bacterium]|nr:FtsK/SpoIIIE domain-containing protein [Acidimicrobiia bacterium]
VLALASWADQRRRSLQRYGRGAARYRARLAARRDEIAEARAVERRQRFASAPDLAELARRAELRSPDLWVRHRGAPDVLDLRLGLGPRPSAVVVRPETRGDEALRRELACELAAGATLSQVPVTVSLVDLPVLALVGAPADTTALATALVLQAACLHSPEDVVLIVGAGVDRGMGRWLKWLPHTRAASSPLAGPHLATTGPVLHQLLRELLVVAEDRAANTDRAIDRRWPRMVAVIDEALQPDPALVSRLAALAPAAGLSIVWLTAGIGRVPRQALATVACRPAVTAEPSLLSFTDPDRADQPLTIERASAQLAHRLAGFLAPVRDASSITASGALPRLVTLNQALGVDQITPGWVADRWAASAGYALPAPVGLGPAGPLMLDLVAHGPHGLIGGTSGAGKSELLMSMVAGLVACNSPNRLNLLFVDYKGGAGSDEFRHLPHTVGYVTNLDALLARRALVSLRAELTRRMSLLQGRAKDLAEMLARHPGEAPPSLVIVVDEFATLVKEVPEFVAGVVDIAQRGRSLGIHLLLATQRPSGAVNENILANTNLRIALRMLDGAESASVIGTNDAALIPTPLRGRAFVRLGPGQLVAFQTAWTGAPRQTAAGSVPVVVRPFTGQPSAPLAAPVPHGEPGPPGAETGGTQLHQLLDAVRATAAQLGLPRGRPPWLDELPERIALTALASAAANEAEPRGWPVVIGLVDDPAAQAQYQAVVDLESGGGLLVLGSGSSGRTTALRTLAVAASIGPPFPDLAPGVTGDDPRHQIGQAEGSAVTIVALDFASRELLALGALPQCALAAAGDDLEAVTRAIALLDRLLGQRRAELAAAARDGLPAPRFSRVLLVIDDYGNLAQTFEGAGSSSQLAGWLEAMNRVIVDGRQVGIHTALSASRRAVVKAGVLAAVANRLVLRQTDPAAYADAGLPPGVTAELDLPPGRGFLNGPNLAQVATLADGGEAGREGEAAALRRLARAVVTTGGSPLADLTVTALPVDAALSLDGAGGEASPWTVVLGPADLDARLVTLDLTHDNLTVLGDPRSGRSTALIWVGLQLARAGIEVWAVGPPGSRLGALSTAHRCLLGRPPAVAAGLAELAAADDERPRILLVDDIDVLEDPAFDAALGPLTARGQRWVASTASLRGYSTNPVVQEMKKARTLLYLQPPGSREVQEITGVHPRLRPGLLSTPGRGVLVSGRVPCVVQVARPA